MAAGLGIYAYIETNSTLANYLLFNYLGNPGLAEVAVFCAAVCGSGLAFCGSIPIQLKYLWVMLVL